MSHLTEIRWHARAGQGAVTAAKLVADTALMQGAFIQAMPEYGPERNGAPMKAYTRLCDQPIELHNTVLSPSIVVVMDETLLKLVDVTEGCPADATIILNTEMTCADARAVLNAPDTMTIAVVNATGIALDTIKRNMPNTPLVGALAKVTGVVPVDLVKERLVSMFGKKFSQEIINANLESVERAYQEVACA